MRTLLDQALLVAAASALAGGGFRLASLAAPRGL
jgi:outer membrane lipopolysaccharide assembly protein LptE/RlpB